MPSSFVGPSDETWLDWTTWEEPYDWLGTQPGAVVAAIAIVEAKSELFGSVYSSITAVSSFDARNDILLSPDLVVSVVADRRPLRIETHQQRKMLVVKQP